MRCLRRFNVCLGAIVVVFTILSIIRQADNIRSVNKRLSIVLSGAEEESYHQPFSIDDEPNTQALLNSRRATFGEETPTDIQLVWLLSFPNSGTSYTLILVERAANLSTATNHGSEVYTPQGISLPIFNDTRGGPYWEGLVNDRGTVRPLPDHGYVLTKSHCGLRCANCGLSEYGNSTLEEFTQECQKTTGKWPINDGGRETVTSYIPLGRVAKLMWLMRHPLENIVARYHLERRNWMRKAERNDAEAKALVHQFLHPNATGFRNWCRYLDDMFESDPSVESLLPVPWSAWSRIPCRGEFYKYTQWHNYVGQMVQGENAVLGDRPLMHWYYEDYDDGVGNSTQHVDGFLRFLHQTRVGAIKKFRTPIPVYRSTHYSIKDRQRIWRLLRAMSTNLTWGLLERYHEEHRLEDHL